MSANFSTVVNLNFPEALRNIVYVQKLKQLLLLSIIGKIFSEREFQITSTLHRRA